MFLDEAVITVAGGIGGRGCVSWRREKYEPYGGPDGGDGGRGGDIVLLADENTDTLSDFASRKKFEADKGRYGSGQNRHGRDAEDLVLRVPPGTTVTELPLDDKNVHNVQETLLSADLTTDGDQLIAARGGRGGYGNAHFKSSVRQRPDFAELGEPGERRRLKLELKLVADVGIIGYPSVGKSTLISVISGARPKIADYPFTTLVPNLGVVQVDDRGYVVCDVPGLIEGASEGKGLGDKFLKHIERCRVLLHVLDLSHALGHDGELDLGQLKRDYDAIRKELTAYSPTLAEKRELIVLNKTDLMPDRIDEIVAELEKMGLRFFARISAATKGGTLEMTKRLLPIVLEEREKQKPAAEEDDTEEVAALPVLRPHLTSIKMGAYRIEKDGETLRVSGQRIEQFTKMTDFGSQGALERFRDVVERIGLLKALKRAGRTDDSPVYIGSVRVDEHF